MSNSLLKRATLTLTVCLLMVLATAISVFAAEPVMYLDDKGEEQTCNDYRLVSELNDGTGVTLGRDGEFTWYYLD